MLLFGPAAAAAGSKNVQIKVDTPSPTVDELECALVRVHPELQELIKVGRFAINARIARRDHSICPDNEIALISMVSGG